MADQQQGVVACHQLLALGFTRRMIHVRLRDGRLHRIHRGVYAVGRRQLTSRGRWMAAALACGRDAVISHHTAAALLELRQNDHRTIHVTVPCARRRRRTVSVHMTALHPDETTTRDAIPVTTIARTLVDLATVLHPDQLLRTVEQADRMHQLNLHALERTMARFPKRCGLPALTRILEAYRGAPPVRSELEREFLAMIRRAGLPEPLVNATVAGLEVDFFWPQYKLAVELDGRGYHTSPRAFETDRVRDATLMRNDIRPLRITAQRIRHATEHVLADVLALMQPRA